MIMIMITRERPRRKRLVYSEMQGNRLASREKRQRAGALQDAGAQRLRFIRNTSTARSKEAGYLDGRAGAAAHFLAALSRLWLLPADNNLLTECETNRAMDAWFGNGPFPNRGSGGDEKSPNQGLKRPSVQRG